MADTRIEWTDKVWNPTRGCSVVSPGCINCYAMRQAHRHSGQGGAYEGFTKATSSGPQWTGEVRLVDEALDLPLRWRKPARVFVNSMSDLFHESLPDDVIDRVFAVMAVAPRHTFQVLTKRAERMRTYLVGDGRDESIGYAIRTLQDDGIVGLYEHGIATRLLHGGPCHLMRAGGAAEGAGWPLPNVWLGVSVENPAAADERIPLLLDTPAAVRFLSCEPLLGPVDVARWLPPRLPDDPPEWRSSVATANGPRDGVDQVIVGGESGPKARPCDVAWIRSIVKQCRSAGVAAFVKQLGAYAIGAEDDGFASMGDTDAGWRATLRDPKGGDMSEWPEDLRVREFPRVAAEVAS